MSRGSHAGAGEELGSFDIVGAVALDSAEDAPARHVVEVLRRHAEVEAQHRELPELADSTEEDWTVLDEYRERLKTTRGELLTHVARAWKPGHPTFDAVVFLDQLRACAWCRRIRTLDGAWIPMAEHIPSDPRVEITHAICPECRDRHFSE